MDISKPEQQQKEKRRGQQNDFIMYQQPTEYMRSLPPLDRIVPNKDSDTRQMDYNNMADNSSIEYYQRSSAYPRPSSTYYPPFEEQEPNRVYSFMPLESVFQQKRPRRKFNEIERLYQCNFYNCTKSYGTLNHLNAHISMQEHVRYQPNIHFLPFYL